MSQFGPDPEYFALTADVVGSREVEDRDGLQRALRSAIEEVRAGGDAPQLVAGPDLAHGDEVQVLARDPATAFRVLRRLADAIHPVQLGFGLGFGHLATALESPPPPVGELDGPCLHRAREALERARDDGRWGAVEGIADADLALVAEGLIALLGAVRRGWTDKQAATVAAVRTGRYQKDVAADLGVAPSVISERLKAANWDAVQWGERALEALLDHADPNRAGSRP